MIRLRHAFALSVALGSLGASPLLLAGESLPAAVAGPRAFPSPEDAARALGTALRDDDDQALRDVLGPGSEDLVEMGKDPVVAANRKAIAADLAGKVKVDRSDPAHASLLLGDDGWPFPIPVVTSGEGWRFDVPAGREEVLARRIGRHEIEVIGICREYADIQAEYASEDRDGDDVREYAQRLLSSTGTHDGLWWEDAADDDPPPLGVPLVPLVRASKDGRSPHAGYYWRILKAQGPAAPGGAHSYVINGNMIAGFALLAVPAEHRRTGVMTFIVSHHGKVFQKDLGAASLDAARAIDAFDPDDSWEEVKSGEEVAPPAPAMPATAPAPPTVK